MLEDKKSGETDPVDEKLNLIFENLILKHKVDVTEKRNKFILTVGGIVFLLYGIFSYIHLDSKFEAISTRLNYKNEELAKQIVDDKNKIAEWFSEKQKELNKIIQSVRKAELSCLVENRDLINSEVSFSSANDIKYLIVQNTGSKVVEWAKVHLYIQDKLVPNLKPDHEWQSIKPSDEDNYSQYFYNLEGRLYSLMLLSPNEKISLPISFKGSYLNVTQFPQTLEAMLKIYYEDDSKIVPFKLRFNR